MHIKRIKTLLRQFHHEAKTSEKYEIAILTDLEEAFDSVWRKGAIYKSYKAGMTNNLLLVLTSFLKY